MTVDIFIPCFIDQMFPQVGWDIIKILNFLGIKYNYNPNQTCCGQPSFNSGFRSHSKTAAIKFLNDFNSDRLIIVPSASCAGYIKNHYLDLFDESSEYYEMCKKINNRIVELTDFLINHIKVDDFGSCFNHKITYHDACSALREYGLKDEPRKLLHKVKGLNLIEMENNKVCCGFGGTFMVKFVPISTAMVQQKVEAAIATGAEYIVSTEASCLLNIQSYINENKLPIKTIHIAEILAGNLK